jgi:hypothetical protein
MVIWPVPSWIIEQEKLELRPVGMVMVTAELAVKRNTAPLLVLASVCEVPDIVDRLLTA